MTRPKNKSYIIGIDEVGRGPLAGPVVVCAVAIPYSCTPTSILKHLPLRDSKKLTPTARALWATDRINITQATNRAATRALTKLLATLPSPSRVAVFLDGGLFVNPQNSKFEIRNLKSNTKQKYRSRFHNSKADTHIDLKIETVIKGDETIPAISLASIVAKEHRDTRMRRAHKKYPYYGFDRHVGYGTKMHLAAIRENGHSPLHRKSFLKKIY